ncbi:hypothetical protein DL93DRAFT_2037261, partial [Clavulina sp. PMI_390]
VLGHCARGDSCWYVHDVPRAAGGGPSEPCMICFESPETYGLLEKCSHAFCLECIRSWRNPSAKDTPTALSGVIKMCPACRVPSSFITPSRMHYKEGDERKVGAIRRYKERCGRIPCKYFTKNLSNPFCPFGYDCFYQHTDPETGEPHIFTHGI